MTLRIQRFDKIQPHMKGYSKKRTLHIFLICNDINRTVILPPKIWNSDISYIVCEPPLRIQFDLTVQVRTHKNIFLALLTRSLWVFRDPKKTIISKNSIIVLKWQSIRYVRQMTMDQYYIRNEHLVLRNTYDLCRFCLCVRLNMRRIKHADLLKSNIPQLYEDAMTYKVKW